MSLIKERAIYLGKVCKEKAVFGGAFIGVELHREDDRTKKYFAEGRVLDSDENYIVVDVRNTLKVLVEKDGIAIPGILTLRVDTYTDETGFRFIENPEAGITFFITD